MSYTLMRASKIKLRYLLVIFIVTECYGVSFNIHNPVYYFTNQETVINELKNILEVNNIANIGGVKGIGKTEAVKKYYSDYQKNYKIAGYFDLSTSLIPQFINFAQKINEVNEVNKQADQIHLDPQNIQKNVIKYLNETNNWLLIFDNVLPNDNKVKNFVDLKRKGHIIFISFNNQEKDGKLIINGLEPEHVDKLLKKIIREPGTDLIEELNRNLTAKGCPTALIVDSAYFLLNNPHYTVKEYIAKITDKNEMVKNYLEITFDTLSNPAKELLFKIALLNNGEISKHIISYLISTETNPNEVISELLNTNILQMKNKDRERPVFSIHDIYKDEILKLLSLKKKQQIIRQIISEVNAIFPVKFKNGSEIRKVFAKDETLFGNIDILLSNTKTYKVQVDFEALELVLNILLNSIEFCYMDKYYECIDWFKTQLGNNKFTPESFREKTTFCAILINLAACEFFDNINSIQALKYLYQAGKITTDALEFNELNSYIYTDIAQVLVIKGDIATAKEFIEKAEKIITENTSGIVKILYVKSLISLLEGNYNKALEKINEEISLCNRFDFSD